MRWLVVATVACIAGCAVLIALQGSDLSIAAGIVLGGTAFVLVLAMVFYAVGRSEDRERAARESGPNDPAL
jgi:high-affinity Fe2+/Pb2+ permease